MEFKRQIRENDRTAPRAGKKEISTIIITQQLYLDWKKQNTEYSEITFKEFKEIWGEIAKQVRHETCYNSLGIYLPFYTGETKIQYLPPTVKAIDIGTSNEIGEKVNQLNINSKGKIGKMTWQRKRACKFNKMLNLFGFEQDRILGQEISEAINKNPELYRTMKVNTKRYDKQRSDSVSEEGD